MSAPLTLLASVAETYRQLDANVVVEWRVTDGALIANGDVTGTVRGPLWSNSHRPVKSGWAGRAWAAGASAGRFGRSAKGNAKTV